MKRQKILGIFLILAGVLLIAGSLVIHYRSLPLQPTSVPAEAVPVAVTDTISIPHLVESKVAEAKSNSDPKSMKNAQSIQDTKSPTVPHIKIAGKNLSVELALTPDEQSEGLSGRTILKDDEGMLFVFGTSGSYLFWMKDMNFPIDMIWVGENNKVVYIKENALPESYPETYGPSPAQGKAKYVLEVVSGFSETNKLKVGDTVVFAY